MKYELTKDLETGNAIIDKEHRELFDAVNKLINTCGLKAERSTLEPTIKFFTNYVNRHFNHEEELQTKNNYPNYTAHKAFHEKYKKDLSDIVSKLPADTISASDLMKLNSHVGLLVSHIKTEDKKLGQFLQNK